MCEPSPIDVDCVALFGIAPRFWSVTPGCRSATSYVRHSGELVRD